MRRQAFGSLDDGGEIAGELPAIPATFQVRFEFRFPVRGKTVIHIFADQFLGGRAFHRRTPYIIFFSLRNSLILSRALNSWDLDVPTVKPSIRPISSWVCPSTSWSIKTARSFSGSVWTASSTGPARLFSCPSVTASSLFPSISLRLTERASRLRRPRR